jgi:hypothetical protein
MDQLGPEAAKSFAGAEVVQTQPAPSDSAVQPVARATQEIDYGRRGKGYIFAGCR